MKKLIAFTLIGLGLATVANTGCSKSGGGSGGGGISGLPDLANFALQLVSSFVPGHGASVTISAPDLGAGTFTINYNLTSSSTPADNLTNQTATLTMSGATGTFSTASIPSGGSVSITINSISNSSGSSNVTSNNTQTFSDSTGLMTCTFKGSAYRATDVHATLAGTQLTIAATVFSPLESMQVVVDSYTTHPVTIHFNLDSLSGTYSTFNGAGGYQWPTSGAAAHDGTITITTTSPLITGTFSFNCSDGSQATGGAFSCPAP